MIVDSSATTARPSASAVATSGWIRTSGLGRGDRGHVRVEVGEHPVDDGLAQPQLRVAVRAGAELAESAGLGDRRLLALLGGHHRSEAHTSDLPSLLRISSAVFCLKKINNIPLTIPFYPFTIYLHIN